MFKLRVSGPFISFLSTTSSSFVYQLLRGYNVDAFVFTHLSQSKCNECYMMHNNGVSCQRYRSIYLNSKHIFKTEKEILSVKMQLATPRIYTSATTQKQKQIKMQRKNIEKLKDRKRRKSEPTKQQSHKYLNDK